MRANRNQGVIGALEYLDHCGRMAGTVAGLELVLAKMVDGHLKPSNADHVQGPLAQ